LGDKGEKSHQSRQSHSLPMGCREMTGFGA